MASSNMITLSDLEDDAKDEIASLCSIDLAEIEDVYFCTPIQTGLMAQPNEQAYNNVAVFSLTPSIDKDKLCASIGQVVAATPIFRTRIVDCQLGPVQVVVRTTLQVGQSSERLQQFLAREKSTPMPFGATLVRANIVESKLVLTVHHALTDYPTQEAFFEDIACVYRGGHMKQRGSYKHFVEHCLSIDDAEARSFWASRFSGQPVVFPAAKPGYYADAMVKVNKPLAVTLLTYGVAMAHVPSYVEVALALTLASYTKADSITFGFILSGRSCDRGKLQSTMGPTITPFPVQVDLKPKSTLRDLLKERTRERREVTKSPSLQYGLQRIRAVSDAAMAASKFNTILNVRPPAHDPSYSGVMHSDGEYEPHGSYCLALTCFMERDGVSVEAFFDQSVICSQQMDRVLRQFEHVLRTIMQLPVDTEMSQINLVNDHDMKSMEVWNANIPEPWEVSLHDRIDDVTRKQPDATAVDGPDGMLTYEQLRSHSTTLAHYLRSRGVGAEMAVALILEKSIWATVAQLAVLKAGGTCVPVDPGYPLAQKQAIVTKCRSKLILASPALMDSLKGMFTDAVAVDAQSILALGSADYRLGQVSSHQAAYILFTSGSTGAPKGVIIEHHSLAVSLMAVGQRLNWTSGVRILQFASYVWGASIVESIGTLMFGGTVCVPSEEERRSGLADVIRAKKVQFALLTPTVIRLISPSEVPSIRMLMSGGETVDPEAIRTWSNKVRFFNGWGQSETAIVSAMAELCPSSPWLGTIGTPIGCALWIVEERDVNKLVPVGTVGEILVEGPTVARCYLDDEKKTASTFITTPRWASRRGSNQRMFRTGAMGKFCYDGSILYVGRTDSQVKISGQRFELEEVEKALGSHPLVQDAFANVRLGRDSRMKLVAVISLKNPLLPNKVPLSEFAEDHRFVTDQYLGEIRDHLVSKIPSYMVPTSWYAVEMLPRTASAKLDRQSIIKWINQQEVTQEMLGDTNRPMDESLTTPTSDRELALRSAWADVLNMPEDHIGRESSFLRLGGDSITAMRVTTACRSRGLRMSVAKLVRSESLVEAAEASEWLPMNTKLRNQNNGLAKLPAFDGAEPHLRSIGIDPANVQSVLPCSPFQEGILFTQLKGAGLEYWDDFTLKLSPKGSNTCVDTELVLKAWAALCDAEPILRTVFTTCKLTKESAIQQVILKRANPSVSCVADKVKDGNVASEKEGLEKPEFSASRPPHHLHLVKVSDSAVYTTLFINHALVDGRSLRLIGRKLGEMYASSNIIDRGPDVSKYMAWVYRQRETAEKYWTSRLSGVQPCLIPTMQDGPRRQDSNTATYFGTPKRDSRSIQAFCRKQGITLPNLIQVTWGLVLHQCTRLNSSVFGCLQSQHTSFEGGDEALGLFLGMLVCHLDVTPNSSLTSLLSRARDDSSQAQEHAAAPLGMIEDVLGFGKSPLFNTAMTIVGFAPSGDLTSDTAQLSVEPGLKEDNPSEVTNSFPEHQTSFSSFILVPSCLTIHIVPYRACRGFTQGQYHLQSVVPRLASDQFFRIGCQRSVRNHHG